MSQYKVRNWPEYSESLKKRGSLSLWINADAIKKWQAPRTKHQVGAPRQYSDDAIVCLMVIKSIYHLAYRQLIGFLSFIFIHMQPDLKIPHFTTVAERASGLRHVVKKLSKARPTDLVLDSTGFKIYGEGEWCVKKHGKQKRRRWKKFHIGICPTTQEIIVAEATELEVADCRIGPKLLHNAPRSVQRVLGDGAYDTEACYRASYIKKQELLVPPRQGAITRRERVPWLLKRDKWISQIIGLGNSIEAKKLWKRLTGYHKRSLVETAISRYKGIFGDKLFSRDRERQHVELLLKAQIMNELTRLGMPKSVLI